MPLLSDNRLQYLIQSPLHSEISGNIRFTHQESTRFLLSVIRLIPALQRVLCSSF